MKKYLSALAAGSVALSLTAMTVSAQSDSSGEAPRAVCAELTGAEKAKCLHDHKAEHMKLKAKEKANRIQEKIDDSAGKPMKVQHLELKKREVELKLDKRLLKLDKRQSKREIRMKTRAKWKSSSSQSTSSTSSASVSSSSVSSAAATSSVSSSAAGN